MGKLICNNKKYRTRCGHEVVINRKRNKSSLYPVRGVLTTYEGVKREYCWTSFGKAVVIFDSHPLDLVEVIKDEDR